MKRILLLAAATFAICLMTTASHAQAEQLEASLPHTIPFHRRKHHVRRG